MDQSLRVKYIKNQKRLWVLNVARRSGIHVHMEIPKKQS